MSNDMGFAWPWYEDIQKVRTDLEARMGAVEDRLEAVNAKLTEASTEIPALVQQLRDEIAANAVQESTLAALEAAGSGLADLVPNPPPPPPPPPVEPPVE